MQTDVLGIAKPCGNFILSTTLPLRPPTMSYQALNYTLLLISTALCDSSGYTL